VSARADRIVALIAGGLLTVLFIACSAVQVAGWTTGAVEKESHRTIRGPVEELQIFAGSGDVVLVPAPGDNVEINSRTRGSLRTPQLEVQVNGYEVSVDGGCDEFAFGHCEATLVVQVPAGTAVSVDTSSGELSAENLNANVSLHTGSGDVDVSRVSGRLDVDTSSGDVNAANVRSDSVRAHTGSGDIDLDFALPPDTLDADTGSGDVLVYVPRGPEAYDVDADTGSGDETIDILRDPGSSRQLRANTGSGDIEIAYRGS
jgi:DUF4097 and DUF4098 domain-containing protein YvlB